MLHLANQNVLHQEQQQPEPNVQIEDNNSDQLPRNVIPIFRDLIQNGSVNNNNNNNNNVNVNQISSSSLNSNALFPLSDDEIKAYGQRVKPQLIKQIFLTFSISFYQLFTVVVCILQLCELRKQKQQQDLQSSESQSQLNAYQNEEVNAQRIEDSYSMYEVFLICMIIYQIEDNFFWNYIRCKQFSILRQITKHSYHHNSLARQFISNLNIFLQLQEDESNNEQQNNVNNQNINDDQNDPQDLQMNRLLNKVGFFLVQKTLYSVIEFVYWRRLQLFISWAFFAWGQYFLIHEKQLFCILYFFIFYIYIIMICSLTLVMVTLICVIFISKTCFKSYYNKQQIKQFATTYSNGIEIDKFSSILPPSSSSSCDAKAIEQKQMKCNVKKYSKSNEPINKFSIQTTTTLPKTEILTQKKQSLTTLKLPLTEINLHTLDYLNLQNNDNENNEKKLNLEEGIMLYETIVNECANKLQHSPSLLNEIINPETNQEVIQEDETVDLRGVQQRRQNRKNKRFKDSCCSVCLVDFKMKETVYRVKCCSSIFHTSCMQNWFQQSKSCPNCRKRF